MYSAARFALVAVVLTASQMLVILPERLVPSADALVAKRILITGDSITQGSAGDYTWRYRLWKKLITGTAAVDFVGPRTDLYNNVTDQPGSQAYAAAFEERSHGAKWGGSLRYDGNGINAMVTSSVPDILVEMLGSNDLAYLTNPADTIANLRTYVADARAAAPGIDIVVGEVVTRFDPWSNSVSLEAQASEYASRLSSLASELNTSSERVVVARTGNGWNPKTMTWDGTHPNPTGETHIAQRVSEALASIGVGSVSPNISADVPWDVPGPNPSVTPGIEEATLSWERSSTGSTGMFIQQRLTTLAGQAWQELPYAVPATNFTTANLVAQGDYQFRLRPSKGWNEGTAGPAIATTVASLPIGSLPSVATSVAVDSNGNGVANTSWGTATNATHYNLSSSNFSRSLPYDQLPYGIPGTNWTFTFLYPGNKYRFRVTPGRGFASGNPATSGLVRMKGIASGMVHAILGDSYSSGLGSEDPGESGSCLRSSGTWGNKLLPLLVSDRSLIACAGKTTEHVQGTQIPQMVNFFANHPNSPKLITMTIGGNDVGFSEELKGCITGNCVSRKAAVSARIANLLTPLKTLYQTVRAASPYADVVVGGYPGLVQLNGRSNSTNAVCGRVENDEREMVNALAVQLNTVIYNAASATGVWSVGQRVLNLFEHHNACSLNGYDEYIHAANLEIIGGEVSGVLDAKTLHPKNSGQLWYSYAFDAEIKSRVD